MSDLSQRFGTALRHIWIVTCNNTVHVSPILNMVSHLMVLIGENNELSRSTESCFQSAFPIIQLTLLLICDLLCLSLFEQLTSFQDTWAMLKSTCHSVASFLLTPRIKTFSDTPPKASDLPSILPLPAMTRHNIAEVWGTIKTNTAEKETFVYSLATPVPMNLASGHPNLHQRGVQQSKDRLDSLEAPTTLTNNPSSMSRHIWFILPSPMMAIGKSLTVSAGRWAEAVVCMSIKWKQPVSTWGFVQYLSWMMIRDMTHRRHGTPELTANHLFDVLWAELKKKLHYVFKACANGLKEALQTTVSAPMGFFASIMFTHLVLASVHISRPSRTCMRTIRCDQRYDSMGLKIRLLMILKRFRHSPPSDHAAFRSKEHAD